jgi:shikimate kinase
MLFFPPIPSSPYAKTQKVDQSNLAGVSASDLAIITSAAQISEDAETGVGGFDDAIAAAGGTGTTAGTDVLRIQIEVSFCFSLLVLSGRRGWANEMNYRLPKEIPGARVS